MLVAFWYLLSFVLSVGTGPRYTEWFTNGVGAGTSVEKWGSWGSFPSTYQGCIQPTCEAELVQLAYSGTPSDHAALAGPAFEMVNFPLLTALQDHPGYSSH